MQATGTRTTTALKKRRILILEDEGLIAWDIHERMTAMGYEVVATCSTAEEAIRVLEQETADLALLDIQLPGNTDGIDVSMMMRTRWNLPAIFLTAFSDNTRIARAARSKPGGYLLKPVRTRELLAAVELTLHRTAIETRIRESTEWFAERVGPNVLGTLVFDLRGIVQFADSRAEGLFERPREEILGRDLSSLFRCGRSGPGPGALVLYQAIASAKYAPRSRSGFVLAFNGGLIPVSYLMTLLCESTNTVPGIVLTLMAPAESGGSSTDPAPPDSSSPGSQSITRIAVASYDPLFRRGFADLLRTSSHAKIVLELQTIRDVEPADLAKEADMIVVDPSFLDQNSEGQRTSLDLTIQTLPILIITARYDIPSVLQAIRRGYSCHLMSGDDVNLLERIFTTVASGETHLSPELVPALISNLRADASNDALGRLSSRELRVLREIQNGKLIKEIAADLNLSRKTVSTFRSRLLKKLGLKTNAELIKVMTNLEHHRRS
jgi:DNA-binding NarL/FixJ family response regulator